jgi:nucleotide-binding universal stress UspA family protein
MATVNVLICVDHSDASRKAVQFAGKILGQCSLPDLNVTLFHVAELLPEYVLSDHPMPGMTPRNLAEAWAERARSQGEKLLSEHRSALQSAGIPAPSLHTKMSVTSCLPEAKKIAAALSLIDEIKEGPYDVVCLGRRGASQLASSFLGGVSEKVIRECQGKTVWLVD